MTIAGASPGARVLVTGAGGFLGGHIVKRLTAQGIDVIAGLRRPAAGLPRAIQLDVTEKAAIMAVLAAERPTHIINCAAYGVDQGQQNYADAFAVNVQACIDLIKAAAGAGLARFVQVGTCSEYASSAQPTCEEAPQRPHNLYALSKAAGSLAALELGRHLSLDVVVARPFGLWGPGEPHFRIVPQIIAACRQRQPLALTDCDVMRDYSFVADAAEWIVRLTFSHAITSGAVINIGSGRPILLRDFALAFADRLDGRRLMEFGKRPQRPNEPKSVVANVSRLIGLIGPLTHTDFDEGLRQMLAAEPV
jgi:nucleoside-diphosphate-sugar epimerase